VAVSVQQQSPQQQVTPPNSETLHRLTVSAAGYLGIETGDPLPIDEIVEQGLVNGYTEDEIRNLIEQEYGSTQTSIPVPKQEDIFGEIFQVDESKVEFNGEVEDGTIAQFREWLQERANNDKTHSYTRRRANKRFAKGKDVDRNFIREYDSFSTILITYTKQRKSNQSIADHADSFYPRKITRKRRRILKQENVYDEAALLSVLAPKFGDRVPSSNSPSTHAHDFIWISDNISKECFKRLEQISDFEVDVSIQHHISEEVETPPSVMERGSALDRKRGDTTALPQELGSNIPLLNCQFDARSASDYIEKWCAHIRSGTNNSFKQRGIRRYRKLGTFDMRSNNQKYRRRLQKAHVEAQAVFSAFECHMQSNQKPGTDGNTTDTETNTAEVETESESDESRFTFVEPDPKPEPNFEFSVNPTGDQ
jgi:hypothetical protein